MAGDVKIRIKSVDAFSKGIKKAIRGVKKLGASLKQVTGIMARWAARAATGIAALGIWSVKTASDAAEMGSKFRAVFKDLSQDAQDWAGETAKATNRSKVELMGFMATLQDTFVPLGFAREEAMEYSKAIAKLTLDLSSFNNLPTEDVLRDIQSAIVGNHETMRKYGVIITEASLKQEAMNSGITQNVKAMTAAEKVQARYNMIVKGTKDAQGDATRTATQFANRVRGVLAAFKDFRIEIGEQLIKGGKLAELMGTISGKIRAMISSLKQSKIVEEWAAKARETFDTVLKVIEAISKGGQARGLAIEAIKKAFANVGQLMAAMLLRVAPLVGDAIAQAFKKTMSSPGTYLGRRQASIDALAAEGKITGGQARRAAVGSTFVGADIDQMIAERMKQMRIDALRVSGNAAAADYVGGQAGLTELLKQIADNTKEQADETKNLGASG